MTSFVPFADFTHNSVPHVPASPKMPLVALYATGSVGVEATAADIHKYRSVGTGVILIDQTPSLLVFAAGLADVADVENQAGTSAALASAIMIRQKHGWQSTIYTSESNISNVQRAFHAGTQAALLRWGIADYGWSESKAQAMLTANPSWAYVQYGDPKSNPHTLVPGTTVTLAQANADIDVAKATWAHQFMPVPPKPAQAPAAADDGILKSRIMGWTGHKMKTADHGKTWTQVNQ